MAKGAHWCGDRGGGNKAGFGEDEGGGGSATFGQRVWEHDVEHIEMDPEVVMVRAEGDRR